MSCRHCSWRLRSLLSARIAWGIGHGRAVARTVRLPRDYYVGLDHLINDRFDRAAEIFARMAEVDGDAVEIQFALGSLFRRRGEVDRAIAIHTRLREQRRSRRLSQRGAFELALDYSSAGLMDRAERLFEELAATREYRDAALDHLRADSRAGRATGQMRSRCFTTCPRRAGRAAPGRRPLPVRARRACAAAGRRRARAEALLRQAARHDAHLPRAQLLRARMTAAAGDTRGALGLYLEALEASPGLALEIIPRVLTLVGADRAKLSSSGI